MKKILSSLAAGCLFTAASTSASLISNGDFEIGTSSDWSIRPFSQFNPSVVSTTNAGWGDYALNLSRDTNTYANPPGISQSFTLSGTDPIEISFDYELNAGETLIFRILAIDSGDYYVYGDDGGSTWTNVSISDNTQNFQANWGTDASNRTAYNNIAANTVLLNSASDIVSSYSTSLTPYSSAETTYRIDFFNPIGGTAVQFDNVNVIPEPATMGGLLGGAALLLTALLRRRHTHV